MRRREERRKSVFGAFRENTRESRIARFCPYIKAQTGGEIFFRTRQLDGGPAPARSVLTSNIQSAKTETNGSFSTNGSVDMYLSFTRGFTQPLSETSNVRPFAELSLFKLSIRGARHEVGMRVSRRRNEYLRVIHRARILHRFTDNIHNKRPCRARRAIVVKKCSDISCNAYRLICHETGFPRGD